MQFDRDKFKALLHYVVWRAGDRDGFGATKLYKVLWFTDARSYMLFGKPITGETYVRQKFGPLPRHAPSVIQELVSERVIRVWSDTYFNTQIRRFQSLRLPDKLSLDARQREIVDYWIKHIADDHTAASISEETHDYVWEIGKLGEELPYYAIFANRIRDPDEWETEQFKEKAKAIGLI
jgi:hypothetical protein